MGHLSLVIGHWLLACPVECGLLDYTNTPHFPSGLPSFLASSVSAIPLGSLVIASGEIE
jgi:hypothetical protein